MNISYFSEKQILEVVKLAINWAFLKNFIINSNTNIFNWSVRVFKSYSLKSREHKSEKLNWLKWEMNEWRSELKDVQLLYNQIEKQYITILRI